MEILAGQAAGVEQLWPQFFSDPTQWRSKRFERENFGAPDSRHKTRNKALWIDDRFNPPLLQSKLFTYFHAQQASRTEHLSEEFFSEPSQLRDKRTDEKNPSPDFNHKTSRKTQLVDNDHNPAWLQTKLAAMVQGKEEQQSRGSNRKISGKVARMEPLWQNFFSDPSQWWDNRLIKKSPKYPDFEHKITHEGLWIQGWLNPPWVKAKIASKTLDPIESIGGLGSWMPLGNVYNLNKLCQEGRLIETINLVELMVQQNVQVPVNTYVGLLKGCARRKALVEGKRVHALIVQSGLDSDIFLGRILVDMYAKCGSMLDAREVFNRMPEHNVFSWTAIISSYVNHGQGKEALNLFQQMQQTGIAPDMVAFIVVLKACARIGALEKGKQLHSDIVKRGFESDVVVGNTLVDMYAKCGCVLDARKVFDTMPEHNVFSWTAIILAYTDNGQSQEAINLFQQMQHIGIVPDKVVYVVVLKACARIAALEQGKQLHSRIIQSGFEIDVIVGSALVDMYAKCGCIDNACEVFNRMNERDVVAWNAMIAGYAQQGLIKEGFALYKQMDQVAMQPNNVTYVILLKACANVSALKHGKQLHSEIIKNGLESDVNVCSALVDMYAKCGSIERACQVFNNMDERNVVSWTAMIAGYAQQGLGREALTLLEKMQREGMKPNEVTYVSVLSSCSHSGLLDEGRHLFQTMCKDHSITPTVDHYACMVNLLCRAGCLADAEDFIKKMPIQPNVVVWMTLLAAARNLGHAELGRRVFDHVVKLEPGNAAAYVQLSNIYATAGRWDEVAKIRTEMNNVGVIKTVGCSWIDVDNQVHAFVAGDTTHPQSKEIRAELRRLVSLMKEGGYVPDLSFAPHDMECKEQEIALCEHSEKLAIAFGLLNTPPGTPIHIKKNLRVCGDCHNATKIISKIVGREIIARDASRFHHFKDGCCSCGDYW